MKMFLVLISVGFYLPVALALSPVGKWATIDDKTGKSRALIEIVAEGDTLSGRILKVHPQKGDTGICSKCPGALKDQPITGLRFLWNVRQINKNVWSDGSILDPKTGQVYRARLTLEDNKLFVRGYIGVALLGRTQVWTRQTK